MKENNITEYIQTSSKTGKNVKKKKKFLQILFFTQFF